MKEDASSTARTLFGASLPPGDDCDCDPPVDDVAGEPEESAEDDWEEQVPELVMKALMNVLPL